MTRLALVPSPPLAFADRLRRAAALATRCASRATSRPPRSGWRPRPAAASSPSPSRKATASSAGRELLTLDTARRGARASPRPGRRAQADAKLRLVHGRRPPRRHPPGRGAGGRRARRRVGRARRAGRRRAGPRALRGAARHQLRLAQAARRCGDAAGRGAGARRRPRESRVRAARGGRRAAARRRAARGNRRRPRAASPPWTRRSPRSRRRSPTPPSTRPSAGIVTEKLVEAGEMIAPRTPVVVITDLDRRVGRRVRGRAGGAAAAHRPGGHAVHRRRRRRHPRHGHLHLAEGRVHAAQRADRRGALEARVPRQVAVDNTQRRAEAGHAGRSGAALQPH